MKSVIKWSVLLAVCFAGTYVAKAQSVQTGKKAPDIFLPNAQGDSVLLSAAFEKNSYVLIDFWASWCGPCRRAMPALKKLYGKYHGRGLEIFSISLDQDNASWKSAMREDGTNWLHVLDEEGNTANTWGVSFIPNTFLLDKHRNIVAINPAPEEMDALLEEKLK